jgi:hypothetical protein
MPTRHTWISETGSQDSSRCQRNVPSLDIIGPVTDPAGQLVGRTTGAASRSRTIGDCSSDTTHS